MSLDYLKLLDMRKNDPALLLLCSDNMPLVVSFLYREFVLKNMHSIPQGVMIYELESAILAARDHSKPDAYAMGAKSYLDDWSGDAKGWLKKQYVEKSDEPHYALTAAASKVLFWLESFDKRSFVGTESRLLTILGLINEMSSGINNNPVVRKEELLKERKKIDDEIAEIDEKGYARTLDSTQLKERFMQLQKHSRELLSDFREVEQNFRQLDRDLRLKISKHMAGKGKVLEYIFDEYGNIDDSDQGKSFEAFWSLISDSRTMADFSKKLEEIHANPIIEKEFGGTRPLSSYIEMWLNAGIETNKTYSQISKQISRFLDDKLWFENRAIDELLSSIEALALSVRDDPPSSKDFMDLVETSTNVNLPMDKPLYRPKAKVELVSEIPEVGDGSDVDVGVLFDQVYIDESVLMENINLELMNSEYTTLAKVIEKHPLSKGLLELVTYIKVAESWPNVVVDEENKDSVSWRTDEGVSRKASFNRFIFTK